MEKQALRERIWDELEESGAARFPFPPHGRIPNYKGAEDAAERLTDLDAWKDGDVIKSNPDAPQLPVRRRALRAGKTLYMAVPRLSDEKCFLRLDPQEIDDVDDATTVSGSSEHGVQVGPEAMEPIDLIVSGSVAVNRRGARVGKGEGYSDLEFGVLREFGLVDDGTTTVTTVHEIQVLEGPVPTTSHDVPIELVFTPERTLETDAPEGKPTGVDWDALGAQRLEEIPVLQRLHPE
jgi:5-formyltetrahydrofolate cyclo-ligase